MGSDVDVGDDDVGDAVGLAVAVAVAVAAGKVGVTARSFKAAGIRPGGDSTTFWSDTASIFNGAT